MSDGQGSIEKRWWRIPLPFADSDDFAFRKRNQYGTLICDLVTHDPIDMLENREETVRRWLQERPYIRLGSRNRSRTFQQAIQRADASIFQISDRFHLTQNLGSLLERILTREFPAKVKEEMPADPVDPPDPAYMGIQEKKRQKNAQKKWKVIQGVQELRRHGMPYSRIARRLYLNRQTAKKYEQSTAIRRKRCNRLINPYLPVLKEQTENGHTLTYMEN